MDKKQSKELKRIEIRLRNVALDLREMEDENDRSNLRYQSERVDKLADSVARVNIHGSGTGDE